MRIVLPEYKILTPTERFKKDLEIIEEVGRSCYMSQHLIKPGSAEKFIKNRIKEGHEAIIEFGDITVQFYIDRGLTHELVRHRLCSFAQESTRYVNYANGNRGREITVVLPSQFISNKYEYEFTKCNDGLTQVDSIVFHDEDMKSKYLKWSIQCIDAEAKYIDMIDNGWKPEEARAILPNSTKAILNMKANYREWRNIFKLRADKLHAHPDMVYIMTNLLREFKQLVPIIFDDIYPEEVSGFTKLNTESKVNNEDIISGYSLV